MLMKLYIKNCFSFNEPVELSSIADMRIKKFPTNVFSYGDYNILKSIGIYGPNNTGKSNLIRTVEAFRNLFLNKEIYVKSNLFTNSSIIELGISFLSDLKKYSFTFKYDEDLKEIIYEKFSQHFIDHHKNENEHILYLKDTIDKRYESDDEDLNRALKSSSNNNIAIYTLNVNQFEILSKIKDILVTFANKIDIIKVNNIPINKTIEFLKVDNKYKRKIVNSIKNSDLYLDDFRYENEIKVQFPDDAENRIDERLLQTGIVDHLKLVSTYKGVAVPSIIYDSTGTKKISAMASYIIEALEENKVLLIDEIDSSLHFKLTRSIVSMFNNELNTNAQLIFTTHDVGLLDSERPLRKEQIWFTHRDYERSYLYSLANFTAKKDGIRDTKNIFFKYNKGLLGAIPNPSLFYSLWEIKDE